MPLFQLAQPAQPAIKGLTGTMSGQGIAAPNLDPNDPNLQPYDEAIKQAETQLNSLLGQFPEIDYQEKYDQLMKDVKDRPVTPAPLSSPQDIATNFAFALGAPKATTAEIDRRTAKREQEIHQKETDLMSMKEALLHGSIQQEVQKGNFKMALKQSEALADLGRAEADRKRYLDTQALMQRQSQKDVAAKDRIQARVKIYADQFHLAEKQQLALLQAGLSFRTKMAGMPGLLPGSPRYDDDTLDLMTFQYMDNLAKTFQVPGTRPKTQPGKAETSKGEGSLGLSKETLGQASSILKSLRTGK